MIIPNKESRIFLKKMGAFTWLTAVALGLYCVIVLGASTMLVGNILLVGVIAFVLSLAVSVLLFRYPLLESVALAYVMYASVDLAAFLPSLLGLNWQEAFVGVGLFGAVLMAMADIGVVILAVTLVSGFARPKCDHET